MDNTVTNVSVGKPKIGGAVYRAPLGTTLPTDATSALSSDWKCLGYVSDEGVTNSNSADTTEIKAWGGDTVLATQEDRTDTWQMVLIETLNVEVAKTVYGNGNVTGTLETGITITANNSEREAGAIVVDMVMREGALKRVVLPNAKVGDLGDIVYNDSEAVGYDTTFNCLADNAGNTHYEYIVRADESE